VSVSLLKEVFRRHTVANEVTSLQQEIGELESKNVDLESLIGYLQSPTYTEEEARLKLGLQRPGEKVLAIPGTNGNSSEVLGTNAARPDQASSAAADRSNPQKWWAFLFHIEN
jgi:hypothetical protein